MEDRKGLPNKPGLWDGVRVQFRVIKGLALRELASEFGKRGQGLVFTFVTPMLQSSVIAIIRLVAGVPAYGGMEIFPFMICGILYVRAFTLMNGYINDVVNSNKGLLYFYHVTELDLYLGKFIARLSVNLVAGIVIYIVMRMTGLAPPAEDPMYLLLLLIAVNFFALGYGMCFAAIAIFVPTLRAVNRWINRVLFFTSGTFFVMPEIPPGFREYLLYNPLVSLTEWTRTFYFMQYQTAFGSLEYFFEWVVGALVLGLLCERLARGHYDR